MFSIHRASAVIAAALVLAAVQGASAHEFKIGSLRIEHPWSRATPGGAKVAAGYFVVDNEGDTPDRLLGATAEISDRVDMHEMATKDGVMTMRPVAEGLAIPPHGKLAFTPAAYHLMFHDLKRPLKQGDRFSGTLTFEKAGTVSVYFVVEGMGAGEHDHSAAQ